MTKITIKRILLLTIVLVGLWSCSDDPASPPENMLEIEGEVRGPAGVTEKENDPPDTKKTFKTNNSSDAINGSANTEKLISGEIPLTGVSVSAFELSDYISNQQNATLLATDKTDQDGNYLVTDIEEGIDLVLVVESTPRQTSIIINTRRLSSGDINSATSIVSEYWAGEIIGEKVFDEEKFRKMLQIAAELLAELSAGELQAVLDGLVPDRFGDGFPDDMPLTLQILVNLLINEELAICEALTLEVTAGTPTDRMIISGVSEQFGEEPQARLYDRAENEGEDDHNEIYHPIFIEWVNDFNEMEFIVPLHPSYPMEGGQAEIIVITEDQSIVCPGIPFEVIALKPTPGTTKSMVNNMENALENWANILGYSPSDLRGNGIEELPNYVKPVALGLLAIDGDNFPNNIRAILNNEAPLFDKYSMGADERALTDALFAQSGFANAMNTVAETIAEFQPTQAISKQVAGSSDTEIWTPAKLDWEMRFQQNFETLNQGAFRASRDAVGAVIGTIGIAGAITGAAPVAAVAGVAGLNLTMAQLIIDLGEKGLPSELQGLELTAAPVVYNEEDDATEGLWEASIEARSEGFVLNWPTVLGAVPGIGKFSRVLNKFPVAEELTDFTLGFLQNFLTSVWSKHDGSGPIEIEPESYLVEIDPTRENENDFFMWELRTQQSKEAFIFTDNETGYIPKAAGNSELRVRTKSGAFKNQDRVNNIILEIKPIEIDIIRDWGGIVLGRENPPFYIQPGEENFKLFARVDHAINKDVSWSVEPEGDGLLLLEMPGEDNNRDVMATEPGRYTVEVESLADTGPRADNSPRRYERAKIIVGGLNVSNPGCVETDEAYQLTASMGGETVDFNELEWDINGPGSIDSDGVYTAGETGNVEIDFYLSDNPEITYSINFRIDETCRSFKLSSDEFDISGTCVYFAEYGGASNSTGIYFGTRLDDISGSITLHTLLKETMPEDEAWTVSDPEWQISSAVNIKTSTTFPWSNWVHLANEPPGPFSITIKHDVINNGRTLSGSFKGEYEFVDYSDDESIHRIETVEGSFRGVTRSVPSECF